MKQIFAVLAIMVALASGSVEAQQAPPITCTQLQANINNAVAWSNHWAEQVALRDQRLIELENQYLALVLEIINQGEPPTPGQVQSLNVLSDAKSNSRIAVSQAKKNEAYWKSRQEYWTQQFKAAGC